MSKLISIQVLRAAAALAVALLHGQYEAGLMAATVGAAFRPSRILPWEAGVDVFFVISGFVMVLASDRMFGTRGQASPFLARRLARIVPLYWLTTTLFLVVAFAAPGSVNGDLGPAYVLASYLFVPAARPDGVVQPLYSLGWTLNYEMFFYALFALSLRLPRRRAVAAVLGGLILVAGVAHATRAGVPLAFWGDPIVFEFGIGMLLGLARLEGVAPGAIARVTLALLGLGGLALAETLGLDRILAYGLPSGCLVAACGLKPLPAGVAAAQGSREPMLLRLAALAGDASYALYLTHPFVIRGMRRVVEIAGLALDPHIFVGAGLMAALVAAVAIHVVVERPLVAFARSRLEPAPTAR